MMMDQHHNSVTFLSSLFQLFCALELTSYCLTLVTATNQKRSESTLPFSSPLLSSSIPSSSLPNPNTTQPQSILATNVINSEVTESNSNSQTFNTPSGIVQQTVTKLPSGKRRITPQLVGRYLLEKKKREMREMREKPRN
jgi:hypothetical protein